MYRWISGFLLILFCHKNEENGTINICCFFFNFAYLLFNRKCLNLENLNQTLKYKQKNIHL